MNYSIKAHPTGYSGVLFRSRLEARWAAFFDLADWKWQYEPLDIEGWTPDFRVEFHCGHSECNGSHSLLVEVKPYYSIDDFKNHPCMKYFWGVGHKPNGEIVHIPADSSAAFGVDPSVVYWEMCHGAGGGVEENIEHWVNCDVEQSWKKAGNIVQYKVRA